MDDPCSQTKRSASHRTGVGHLADTKGGIPKGPEGVEPREQLSRLQKDYLDTIHIS